jgi:hypothetical protein
MQTITAEIKFPFAFEIPDQPPSQGASLYATPEEFGAIGDGGADDAAALNLADADPRPVCLSAGKNYRAGGQVQFGRNSGKRWFSFCSRSGLSTGGATIKLEHNAAACSLIGPTGTTSYDTQFSNIRFAQGDDATQTAFEIRRARGVHFFGCQFENFHKGFNLGTASDACYITTFSDCEGHMRAGHSHFIEVVNSTGQLDLTNSYIEGAYVSGTKGVWFRESNPNTFDHFIVKGGYLGRFGHNILVDGRTVNLEIDGAAHLEGQVHAGLALGATGSGEHWNVAGSWGVGLPGAQSILLAHTQTTQPVSGILLHDLSIQRAYNNCAIEVYSPAGNPLQALVIDGVNIGEGMDSSDNNHAMIELYGVGSGFINNVFGRNFTGMNRFAYVVRSQVSGGAWNHGSALYGAGTVAVSVRS